MQEAPHSTQICAHAIQGEKLSLLQWTHGQWTQAGRQAIERASQAAACAWLGSPLPALQTSSQPKVSMWSGLANLLLLLFAL